MVEKACRTLKINPQMMVVWPLMMRIAGFFIPEARAAVEMMYEFTDPFVVIRTGFNVRSVWSPLLLTSPLNEQRVGTSSTHTRIESACTVRTTGCSACSGPPSAPLNVAVGWAAHQSDTGLCCGFTEICWGNPEMK
jgi:hypothetical protein